MPEKTNLEKLEDILSTVADVIRQAEGTDDPVLVSSMRERIALADTVKFTVDNNGMLTGFGSRQGSEDTSIPVDTEDYYRKLLVNFSNKIRKYSEKLDIDDILADKDKTCGTVIEQGGKYGAIIPNCVTSISQRVAWKKQYLTSIVIPSSVTEIGAFAFQECTDLVSATVNATSAISDSMFRGCSNLTNVVLSDTVTTIKMVAFAQCSSLDTIDISNVTSIGSGAFTDCYNLEHVTFPINLESLGDHAFAGCKIKSLPDLQNLTSILDSTFENCTSLQDIVIPNNIKSIGYHAFYVGNAPIRRISVPSDADVHVYAFGLSNVNYLETVDAPLNCCHVSNAPNLTSLHINSIGSSTSIGGPSNLPSLVDLTLPVMMSSSYDIDGFNGCSSLVNLVIPEGVENILQHTFEGCTSLQNLTLPKSLRYIDTYGVFTNADLSNGNVTVYIDDTLDNIDSYFSDKDTIPTVLVQLNVSTATFIDINGNSADIDPSTLIHGGSGSGSGSGSGDGNGEEESYEE